MGGGKPPPLVEKHTQNGGKIRTAHFLDPRLRWIGTLFVYVTYTRKTHALDHGRVSTACAQKN